MYVLFLVQKHERKMMIGGEEMNQDIVFDYGKLRGRIREVFKTEGNFARALGIGRVSLSKRLNNTSDFSEKEIFISCNLLGIDKENLTEYFFREKVQKHEQSA